MNKRTFLFECRKQQIIKILAKGPHTYDELYKALGSDPNNHIRAMLRDGLILSRREKVGQNGNFSKHLYYLESQPETALEDINGFSDPLRVLMGYAPIGRYRIDGQVTIFDAEDYHDKHKEEIRRQAPCIGTARFGSMQSAFGDLEVYGAA